MRALSDVYDPCCREKGISVVDMGLLRSVEVHDRARPGGAAAHLGLVPVRRAACSPTSRTRSARSRASTPARSRSSGTRRGRPTGSPTSARRKLRFLPDPVAVGDRDAYLAAHTPRRTAMIGDAFVFDGVAHPFNFTAEERLRAARARCSPTTSTPSTPP